MRSRVDACSTAYCKEASGFVRKHRESLRDLVGVWYDGVADGRFVSCGQQTSAS